MTQGDLGLNRIEEPGVPAVDVIEEILEEYEEMNEGELPCTLRPDRFVIGVCCVREAVRVVPTCD